MGMRGLSPARTAALDGPPRSASLVRCRLALNLLPARRAPWGAFLLSPWPLRWRGLGFSRTADLANACVAPASLGYAPASLGRCAPDSRPRRSYNMWIKT